MRVDREDALAFRRDFSITTPRGVVFFLLDFFLLLCYNKNEDDLAAVFKYGRTVKSVVTNGLQSIIFFFYFRRLNIDEIKSKGILRTVTIPSEMGLIAGAAAPMQIIRTTIPMTYFLLLCID